METTPAKHLHSTCTQWDSAHSLYSIYIRSAGKKCDYNNNYTARTYDTSVVDGQQTNRETTTLSISL